MAGIFVVYFASWLLFVCMASDVLYMGYSTLGAFLGKYVMPMIPLEIVDYLTDEMGMPSLGSEMTI